MMMLIVGLFLFVSAHLVLSLAPNVKQNLVKTFGADWIFKALFAAILIASLTLMVMGWRTSFSTFVYDPPTWGRHANMGLMLIALILFFSSQSASNIMRFIRHPQLTSVALWSVGHLLANGDNKSLILFGTFGIWSVAEMFTISAREGKWQKPEPKPITSDLLVIGFGVAAYAVLLFAHSYISGVSIIPQT